MAATNTRERLITAAGDLFYRSGFQAVGMDSILSEVGISKQAFYKHFESKDALIVAVLEERDRVEIDQTLEAMRVRGKGDPAKQLLAFFEFLDEWFRSPDFRGCMFMHAATEFPAEHDPIHKAAVAHGEHLQRELAKIARQAGADDPEELASQLMLLVHGAVSAHHQTGTRAVAKAAMKAAELLVERYCAARV